MVRPDQALHEQESIPHRLHEQDEHHVAWTSHTRGNVTVRHPTTQALIVLLEMAPNAALELHVNGQFISHTLAELLHGARAHMTGGFVSPAVRLHRAVPEPDYTFQATVVDDTPEQDVDCYYVRLAQRNGQCAWLSPIWVKR